MDQDFINNIYSMYPWASEETLQKLNGDMQEQNINMGTVAAVLSKKDAAAIKDMARTTKQGQAKANRAGVAALKTLAIGQGAMTRIMADADPANAVAELSHEASKLLANAGIGISNMGSGMGKFGAVLRGVARHAGTPLVVATGFGVIFAKLLTEQEKQARRLIEFGAVVADLDHWTNLRHATRDLGMAIKDFEEVMTETKGFAVQAEGSAFEGALRMAEFAKEIDSDKTFRDFGMGIQDQTRFIGQEIQTLFEAGEITSINAQTKKRVIDSYKSANNLALFTANAFGMQREEALRLRDEARTNVQMRLGLRQNADLIAEKYGEQAAANINDANGTIRVLNEALMGSDFAQTMEDVLARFVVNLRYDDTAANDMDENFLEVLASAPGAAPEIIDFIEKAGTGQFKTEEETTKAYREVFKILRNAPFLREGDSDIIKQYNDMIAQAKQAAGGSEFLRADLDGMSSDFLANLADSADTSIEVMNNMAVAFQNAQELLTPGFSSMGHGFGMLTDGIMSFGRAVSRAFYGDTTKWDEGVAELMESQMQRRLAEVNETNIVATVNMVKAEIDELQNEIEGNRGLLYATDDDNKIILDAEGNPTLRGKVIRPDYVNEDGETISGEEATEEQIAILEQRYLALVDDLRLSKEYLIRLEEKENEFEAAKTQGAI